MEIIVSENRECAIIENQADDNVVETNENIVENNQTHDMKKDGGSEFQ